MSLTKCWICDMSQMMLKLIKTLDFEKSQVMIRTGKASYFIVGGEYFAKK